MIAKATNAATIVAGDLLKLHRRSLSTNRRHRPGCAAGGDGVLEAVNSATGNHLPLDPQARIDDVVEQVDDQIAQDRMLAGFHFPSDLEAGRKLSAALLVALFKSPELQNDLKSLPKHPR